MNIEDIEKFFAKKATLDGQCVQITFKKREAMYGLFLKDTDYTYLKAKNFWRIVPQSQLEAYRASKNVSLAKIFNGAEFSKLDIWQGGFN